MAPVAPEAQLIVEAAGAWVPRLLDQVEDRLRELGAAHGPTLAGHAGATIAAGGKRLRPLVVLVAAGAEPAAPAGLVRAAAAVELVHAATLVHDDVLDDAPLRRGQPTVYAAAGRGMATAAGDLLFATAFAELARNGSGDEVRALSRAGSALAEGELLQRADAWDVHVSVERYRHRCELKTARLFEAACTLGVLEGGGSARDAAALAGFGLRIGLAFQLLDDVLDVTGPPERTGKHRGTDLLDGTVTLPLILAREEDASLRQLDLRAVRTPEAAAALCDVIAASGALDASRAQALELVDAAKRQIPAEAPPAQRRALELVADSVVARYA